MQGARLTIKIQTFLLSHYLNYISAFKSIYYGILGSYNLSMFLFISGTNLSLSVFFPETSNVMWRLIID